MRGETRGGGGHMGARARERQGSKAQGKQAWGCEELNGHSGRYRGKQARQRLAVGMGR